MRNPSRLRAWGQLFFCFFLIWAFAFIVGPWIQKNVPIINQIFQVVEERDIDSAAYFYTAIEASYDGASYLHESIKLMAPEEAGLTIPFIAFVILTGVILWIGFRYLPMD
ncbi:MAG: hypothetical protein V3S16_02240 [Candidatus Desulfatibia sp.]|uniref:hypothetical protein n=1 Tax=Candidatus Desulfatibia sp. TaxID=3101189 RepID=UPI002F2C9C14